MEDIDIIDFGGLKKTKKTDPSKKKKKKVVKEEKKEEKKEEEVKECEKTEEVEKKEVAETEKVEKVEKVVKEVEKRDWKDPFTYDFMLERIRGQLQEKKPELAEKIKFVMKVPQVGKIPGKRSAWTNFGDICKVMKRAPEHVC